MRSAAKWQDCRAVEAAVAAVQSRVVTAAGEALEAAVRAEASVQTLLADALRTLDQSILAKAFRGELS